jgi:signal transduction histidine kinase
MKKADQALLQKGWAMVERNIERISHLVRDLLSYSKVGIGTMEPTDLNELVRDAATLYVEMARAAGVELILELDDSLGEVMVDPKALHTCIVNLLSNALDACREDKEKSSHRVVIGTKRGPAAEVLIQVEDNGVGMDRSTQEKLFQRFFSTKGTRGTGLGLMLTHKLVREHGGRIWAESQPGKGSVFTIAIPQSPSAAYANS